MKDSILNLLIESSDDLIYEINLQNKKLIWHSNIIKYLDYPSNFKIDTLEQFLNLLKEKDKRYFFNKLKDNNKYKHGKIKIKNNENLYLDFLDKSILYKENDEKFILGSLKKISKFKNIDSYYENILDNTNDFIFYKDLNLKYIGCNETMCSLLNLNKEDIIGKTDFEIFLYTDAARIKKYDEEILKNKNTKIIKEKITLKDGKEIILLTKKSLLLDSNNNVYALFGVSKDITKELKYQEKIKNNQQTYNELFEANQIPVLLINMNNGSILKSNQSAQSFYGYSKKEFSNLNINDINVMPKCDLENHMKDAFDEKRNCFYFQHKKKDKTIIDVEVYSGPLKYNGQIILYSLIFDISKRKIAEKKLNQAHTIYQNTKEGIFITDLESNILSVNKAFENITGYKESEVINKSTKILKSNEHSEEFYKNLWVSLIKNGYWEGEIINKTKNGEKFPQWISINTVYDEKKNPVKYVGVFSDFSKLKENEEQLRQKDQLMFQQSKMAAMGEMLRNIAHQWRQPLSVISSSATGLKLKKEFGLLNDDDFSEFADGILKSANYLSDTIEDFTNYFKNNKNKEFFFIKSIIKKALQLSKSSFENNNVEIELNIDYDIEIFGIENELIQVLLNIINNSIDAFQTTKNFVKRIIISKHIENKNLIITIKDNAGGINNSILDKIFEPYFTTKHQSQGTGVGLYMSQQIIQERLNGNIEVSNTISIIEDIKYKGVEFRIIIPLNQKD